MIDFTIPERKPVEFDHDVVLGKRGKRRSFSLTVEAEVDVLNQCADLTLVIASETQRPIKVSQRVREELECRAVQRAMERW